MAEIVHETFIAATPERVYAALATERGLASHWTARVSAQPEVGGSATFTFGPAGEWVYRMRIDEVEPADLVRWRVVEAARSEEPTSELQSQA